MKLTDLTTPAFLVDRDTVARNCDAMLRKARESRVVFRPHVKTHKTLEIGRMQHGGSIGPITVSTLAEAEFFADGGFRDIAYAVPVAPQKLARCAALARRLDRFAILVDHPETLDAVEGFARAEGVVFDVYLKVDCGYHRAGVDPKGDAALDLARHAGASRFIRFAGLLTHAGHSYHARNRDEISAVAVEETGSLTRFAEQMRAAGLEPGLRSIGSTPTASVVDRFVDCDEVRPGNYVFYDAFQAMIGSCRLKDVAVSVVTTVIGVYPAQQKLIVDAGALAMSKDRGADHLVGEPGFGVVCDLALRTLPLRFTALSQEHGQILTGDADANCWPIGTRLRIVPNHSCLTAALFDHYDVVERDEVVDSWTPVRGW
jgi:D-serine deaminase-like pyridoxal phosphate-dependent protein